jgi:hypothetical protein
MISKEFVMFTRINARIVLISTLMVCASGAVQAEDFGKLIRDGKPTLDARYRFEHVDQAGRLDDAEAHTMRIRAGFESGRINGIGGVFDAEWIEAIGGTRFNDTINGKTRYPVVADPDDFAVNQLFLISENTIPDTKLIFGRQRLIWDNARFIGNVGFRQNEQTYDAARIATEALPKTSLEYLYLDEVHRIFGRDSANGRL